MTERPKREETITVTGISAAVSPAMQLPRPKVEDFDLRQQTPNGPRGFDFRQITLWEN